MLRILISAGILLFIAYYLLNNSSTTDGVKIQDRAEHEADKVKEILDQRTEDLQKKLDAQLQQ